MNRRSWKTLHVIRNVHGAETVSTNILGESSAVEMLLEFIPIFKYIVIHFIDVIHVIDADVPS